MRAVTSTARSVHLSRTTGRLCSALLEIQAWAGDLGDENVVRKQLTVAGIKGTSSLALRHTFATWRFRRRLGLRIVLKAIGHESLAITSRYVGLGSVLRLSRSRRACLSSGARSGNVSGYS